MNETWRQLKEKNGKNASQYPCLIDFFSKEEKCCESAEQNVLISWLWWKRLRPLQLSSLTQVRKKLLFCSSVHNVLNFYLNSYTYHLYDFSNEIFSNVSVEYWKFRRTKGKSLYLFSIVMSSFRSKTITKTWNWVDLMCFKLAICIK